MTFNWKEHLTSTINSTFYCSIATQGAEGVWVNPVYFACDGNFNLYFISMPQSRHMRNIGKGAPIAVAIYSTAQPPGEDVRGIQLSGWAELIADEDVADACDIYYGRSGASDAMGGAPPPDQHMGDAAVWKFVKVKPVEIYYFDTRYFDEVEQGRQLVPVEELIT